MDTVQIWQVHIPTDSEFKSHAEVEVNVDPEEHKMDYERRSLVFSSGKGEIEIPQEYSDHPFVYQHSSDGRVSRTIIKDWKTALAYYLYSLETHDVPEQEVHSKLSKRLDMDPYYEFQESLTPRKRRLRLVDLLEWRVEEGGDWASEVYLSDQNTTFRSTNLSSSGRKLAESISQTLDVKPKLCYHTAQHAILKHKNNHRVSYCEGLALPKQAGQVIRHAWIEIDGDVAELTWPWHSFDGDEAVYMGVEVPKQTVVATRKERNVGGSILLSEDEVRKVSEAMASPHN